MNKTIYIDMDDVLCDFMEAYRESIARKPEIIYPQSQYGFWRNLKPVKGSIEAVHYLSSIEIFDVYILTSPSVLNPLCYTEKRLWVEDHLRLEMVNRLIISPNKGLCKGDYLIDDMDNGNGRNNFEGKILQFGSKEFGNWEQVLAYFNEKYDLMKS